MSLVSSWGRLGHYPHRLIPLTDLGTLSRQIQRSSPGIAHGMGRSYGDQSLNPQGTLWLTRGLDHFIAFAPNTGSLDCDAGVLLRDIQRLAAPHGWLLAVTPGTELVTVGGAIANDVHGKNHHVQGSFGDHVLSLTLVRSDGELIECGPDHRPDWFAATVGGMGLTGVISQARIRLLRVPGPWLQSQTLAYHSLAEFFALADASESAWQHSVSWIDVTARGSARGLFMRANPVAASGRPEPRARHLTVPFAPPLSLINRLTLKPFNWVYYRLHSRRSAPAISHYVPFNYPLDAVQSWNRIYGPRGFFQYQCVVPRQDGQASVQALLDAIAASGFGSFLAVLKTFGQRTAPGMLSFPRPGTTLAVDFANTGQGLERLFGRLDAIVAEAGGRLYAAKDARMPRALFEAGYPRLGEFLNYRDPGMSSAMTRRLIGS